MEGAVRYGLRKHSPKPEVTRVQPESVTEDDSSAIYC